MAHQHDHTQIDFAEWLPMLEQEAELFAPVYRQAAGWLREWKPEPELIADVGSGPGVISCLLADAFPQARVVAVDGSAPLLEAARSRAAEHGIADRFSTLEAELADGISDLEYPADLVWSSRTLHHVGDQRAALTEFARRLAPGGASPSWRAAFPRATSRATSVSAARACSPVSTRCRRSGSPRCGPSCPVRWRRPRTGPPC